MEKKHWLVIFTYIMVQFSGILFGVRLLELFGLSEGDAISWWTVSSFAAGLFLVFWLLREDLKIPHFNTRQASPSQVVGWSIAGVFLAFGAQMAAALIEIHLLGIEPGSQNTELLVEMAKLSPILILGISILGPIFEEIIFRQIIFRNLYKKFNFLISAIISSLIFAAVHFEFEHLLVYTAMGITFSFLYVKTNRIIVPIIAHVAMNSFVVIVRVFFADQIEEAEKQFNQIQSFIGGF